MTVGPIMQGFVLMGIIYWYSKGMISMINDYYRSEFQRKLQHTNDTTLDGPNYDVEQFDELLNVERFIGEIEMVDDYRVRAPALKEEEKEFCHAPKDLDYFMDLIRFNSKEAGPVCVQQSGFSEEKSAFNLSDKGVLKGKDF